MSGPFGSSQWMYNAGGDFYSYAIDNSLRFPGKSVSSRLDRTFSAGNNKTWTFSWWFKPDNVTGNNGTLPYFFATSGNTYIRQQSGQGYQIEGNLRGGGGTNYFFSYAPLLRDTSAWYHCVIAVDTSQGTSSNRIKFYLNGEQQTTAGSLGLNYPPQNHNTQVNTAVAHRIGAHPSAPSSYAFSGYMAEINFVDGSQLTADSFGQTKSGIWIPKEYSGSYGTNGFHLDFANSSSLGNDVSGNNNDFTPSGLSSHDQVPDSPTNNWCILERNQNRASYSLPTLSEGNLKFGSAGISTSWGYRASNMEFSSGKWYAECRVSGNTYAMVGVFNTGYYGESHFLDQNPQNNTGGWLIYHDGATTTNSKFDGVTASATITDFNENDIVGLELDADNGTVKFYVNGSLQTGLGSSGTVNISEGTGDAFRFWSLTPNGGGITFIWNFGQDSTFAGATTAGGNADDNGLGDFKYSPSSGYLTPCSANLPDPAIDPAVNDVPEDYFNTVLYTGNGNDNRSITGVGFKPDFVWLKGRNEADAHVLTDVVRGTNSQLFTDSNSAQSTSANNLQAFESDGFQVGTADRVNGSGDTMVGWSWLGGGTGVSNTDGSITSTVSANPDAGFSIATYTGDGSGTANFGHGLSAKPEMIIIKNRTGTAYDWKVFHHNLSTVGYILKLNSNAGEVNTGNTTFGGPTSSLVVVKNNGTAANATNISGVDYVAYCFHSVEGYSKIGSYEGNGSNDGSFIYTGFRPAWVMVKRTNSSSDWVLWDAKRDPYNYMGRELQPDKSDAELSYSQDIDFLSNGFKTRRNGGNFNASGGSYVYMAFAEHPFKYANAR